MLTSNTSAHLQLNPTRVVVSNRRSTKDIFNIALKKAVEPQAFRDALISGSSATDEGVVYIKILNHQKDILGANKRFFLKFRN